MIKSKLKYLVKLAHLHILSLLPIKRLKDLLQNRYFPVEDPHRLLREQFDRLTVSDAVVFAGVDVSCELVDVGDVSDHVQSDYQVSELLGSDKAARLDINLLEDRVEGLQIFFMLA